MSTDTSERGLERLICTAMTGHACDPPKPGEKMHDRFKQFMDNEGFKRWMTDTVFGLTYDQKAVS